MQPGSISSSLRRARSIFATMSSTFAFQTKGRGASFQAPRNSSMAWIREGTWERRRGESLCRSVPGTSAPPYSASWNWSGRNGRRNADAWPARFSRSAPRGCRSCPSLSFVANDRVNAWRLRTQTCPCCWVLRLRFFTPRPGGVRTVPLALSCRPPWKCSK